MNQKDLKIIQREILQNVLSFENMKYYWCSQINLNCPFLHKIQTFLILNTQEKDAIEDLVFQLDQEIKELKHNDS